MTNHQTASAQRPRPIRRLLIANRGEIALRVMRTAQARGITCIAVYSEPDAAAPFVRAADIAVALPGRTSAETYLDAALVLAAAARTGADAIHPGYGFLSENATFAQAVIDAGLTWVGPPPSAISAMAEKVPAKRLVAQAGVPLVPGAELDAEAAQDRATVHSIAATVGFPLMIKASAGGGGKGMRVVREPDEVAEAVAGAQREAASAFGDATVFFERYLPEARHIEVQVFADDHGTVAHLFERECSIQRRHQKIIEEAPAPFLPDAVREGLRDAAVAAARAIDYRGAGTVEFLVDGDDYYFLEMNTRLQVEHPVTEMVTGLDLVGLQLDVAAGMPLPQLPQTPNGHAVEARLYAEDPRNDDLPSVGLLSRFAIPDPAVRVDSGVESGSEVSPFYDPMLAKVISHGRNRDEAAAMLARGLRTAQIHGVRTNRDLLVAILEAPAFLDSAVSTAFLTHHAELRDAAPPAEVIAAHALAAAAAWWQVCGAGVPDVAAGRAPVGWRNVPRPGGLSVRLTGAEADALRLVAAGVDAEPEATDSPAPAAPGVSVHRERLRDGRDRWGLAAASPTPGEQAVDVQWLDADVRAATAPGETANAAEVGVTVRGGDGTTISADVTLSTAADGSTTLYVDDPQWHSTWQRASDDVEVGGSAAGHGPSAPVPGTVAAVMVQPGDEVSAGQTLVVVEAMKMEHRIVADDDATVGEVLVAVGDSVEAHQVVVVMGEAQ